MIKFNKINNNNKKWNKNNINKKLQGKHLKMKRKVIQKDR
jgi:hypothetical protein